MTTIGDGVESSNTEVLVPAFAKLQGENFEYYMRKYSIILGRNSKKKSVDLDLRDLGGGMAISRHHARIYYDFTFRCFALEVIGRNGCIIKNVLFMPGNPPIKLDSQDLLQIGEVRFYFLLPTRSFFETLEAASQIAPPLPPQLVVVPPASSNDEMKGEEREGDREESLGIGHGEGGVSGPIVQGSNAREAEGSSGILSSGLEAGRQILSPLPSPLVAVPLASSNDERKGEEKEGNRKENLGVGHVEVDVSGLIVDEFNAREAEHPSGVLCGALEAVRQIAPPLPPPLVVVPPTSNDEWKGEERESNREEGQGIDHGEGIGGLIVDEGNAREAGSSSRELSGALEAAGQIVPPPLPQLVAVLRASNDDRKGEEKEGDMKESALEAAGQIVPPPLPQLVVVLRASNDDNRKGEEKEGDMEENALEAAGQIVPPPPPQLVAVPHASNDDRKGEEKEGGMEESPGVEHGEGDVSGLIVEEFNGGEADCSSGMLSGGIKQYSLSNENLEPRSSDREADNQEETPDVHVLKANLPGIKKEQIKLEVEDGKIWIQISAELISVNEEKTDMWHCVENSSGKFLRRYFVLPENAKIDQIKVTMEKGVLTVTVSKGKIEMPGQSVVRSIEISD